MTDKAFDPDSGSDYLKPDPVDYGDYQKPDPMDYLQIDEVNGLEKTTEIYHNLGFAPEIAPEIAPVNPEILEEVIDLERPDSTEIMTEVIAATDPGLLTELDMANLQQHFARMRGIEITPDRRELAYARMQTLAAKLAEDSPAFLEYLDRLKIPYQKVTSEDGRKAIQILLEDIAESDLRKRQ